MSFYSVFECAYNKLESISQEFERLRLKECGLCTIMNMMDLFHLYRT